MKKGQHKKPPDGLIKALRHYGKTIKTHGWRVGEPLIKKYSRKFPEFKRWAYALGIMLRADELLDEDKGKRGVR